MKVTYDIGSNLQAARRARNLTQERVAKSIGVSRPAISSYERNAVEPPLSVLRSLAILYHVSVDQLLELEPADTRALKAAYKREMERANRAMRKAHEAVQEAQRIVDRL